MGTVKLAAIAIGFLTVWVLPGCQGLMMMPAPHPPVLPPPMLPPPLPPPPIVVPPPPHPPPVLVPPTRPLTVVPPDGRRWMAMSPASSSPHLATRRGDGFPFARRRTATNQLLSDAGSPAGLSSLILSKPPTPRYHRTHYHRPHDALGAVVLAGYDPTASAGRVLVAVPAGQRHVVPYGPQPYGISPYGFSQYGVSQYGPPYGTPLYGPPYSPLTPFWPAVSYGLPQQYAAPLPPPPPQTFYPFTEPDFHLSRGPLCQGCETPMLVKLLPAALTLRRPADGEPGCPEAGGLNPQDDRRPSFAVGDPSDTSKVTFSADCDPKTFAGDPLFDGSVNQAAVDLEMDAILEQQLQKLNREEKPVDGRTNCVPVHKNSTSSEHSSASRAMQHSDLVQLLSPQRDRIEREWISGRFPFPLVDQDTVGSTENLTAFVIAFSLPKAIHLANLLGVSFPPKPDNIERLPRPEGVPDVSFHPDDKDSVGSTEKWSLASSVSTPAAPVGHHYDLLDVLKPPPPVRLNHPQRPKWYLSGLPFFPIDQGKASENRPSVSSLISSISYSSHPYLQNVPFQPTSYWINRPQYPERIPESHVGGIEKKPHASSVTSTGLVSQYDLSVHVPPDRNPDNLPIHVNDQDLVNVPEKWSHASVSSLALNASYFMNVQRPPLPDTMERPLHPEWGPEKLSLQLASQETPVPPLKNPKVIQITLPASSGGSSGHILSRPGGILTSPPDLHTVVNVKTNPLTSAAYVKNMKLTSLGSVSVPNLLSHPKWWFPNNLYVASEDHFTGKVEPSYSDGFPNKPPIFTGDQYNEATGFEESSSYPDRLSNKPLSSGGLYSELTGFGESSSYLDRLPNKPLSSGSQSTEVTGFASSYSDRLPNKRPVSSGGLYSVSFPQPSSYPNRLPKKSPVSSGGEYSEITGFAEASSYPDRLPNKPLSSGSQYSEVNGFSEASSYPGRLQKKPPVFSGGQYSEITGFADASSFLDRLPNKPSVSSGGQYSEATNFAESSSFLNRLPKKPSVSSGVQHSEVTGFPGASSYPDQIPNKPLSSGGQYSGDNGFAETSSFLDRFPNKPSVSSGDQYSEVAGFAESSYSQAKSPASSGGHGTFVGSSSPVISSPGLVGETKFQNHPFDIVGQSSNIGSLSGSGDNQHAGDHPPGASPTAFPWNPSKGTAAYDMDAPVEDKVKKKKKQKKSMSVLHPFHFMQMIPKMPPYNILPQRSGSLVPFDGPTSK